MADGLPWVNPRKLLAAWTPTTYSAPQPPYVNVTQVGSVAEVTVRGDDGIAVKFTINNWWLNNLADTLKNAANEFECGLEDRIYREQTATRKEDSGG